MVNLDYENEFLSKHGLLPEQAIARIAELNLELAELEGYTSRLKEDVEYLEEQLLETT